MELIKPDTLIEFIGRMKSAVLLSIVLIVISFVSLIYHKGPNWGVEFIGGTEIQLKLKNSINTSMLRNLLDKSGFSPEFIQQFGLSGDNEYIINFSPDVVDFEKIQEFQQRLEVIIKENPELEGARVLRIDYIGPKVGKELIRKAVFSIVLGWIGILLYLMIRFEISFALGAVVAIVHDIIITLGAISILDKEFTLAIVAGLLAVIGYSVNDTIVVFDRIRENVKRAKDRGYKKVVNLSINQTLSRTILTSVTVFLVLIPLFVFGGSVIHDFAYTLIVGFVAGTYSSIFIASAFIIYWRYRRGELT